MVNFSSLRHHQFISPLAVVLLYATFAALWIFLSDSLLEWLLQDTALIILFSMLKGWLFVLLTSLLLYWLLQRMTGVHSVARSEVPPAGSPWRATLPFVLLALLSVALTAAELSHSFSHHRNKAIAQLQTVADLKSEQLGGWLRERWSDAEFVQSSVFFASSYQRWLKDGDRVSQSHLLTRLEQLRQNRGFSGVVLLDSLGKRIWGTGQEPAELAGPLQKVIRQAMADRHIHRVGPYRDRYGNVRLDFVVPMITAGEHPPLIILQTDPNLPLFSTLQHWPVPSATAEALLFQRVGDRIMYLNVLRDQVNSSLQFSLPLSSEKLLAAKALRGDVASGEPIEGNDYNGVPSIAVVRAVADTDWYLLVKMGQAEVYEETAHDLIWVGLAGLLSLFMVGAAYYLMRQRQQLQAATLLQQSQQERLHALQLLSAVADSSIDAIYAKDLDGRYVLFNRAAGEFVGKSPDEVLGRDDSAIFPPQQVALLQEVTRRVMAADRVLTEEERLTVASGAEAVFLSTRGPLRDASGRVIGMFGISRDITDRTRSEQAMRASDEFKHAILDSVNAHIAVLDSEGGIIAVNRPWQRFAEENGPHPGDSVPHTGVGSNYLDACDHCTGLAAEGAQEACTGIRAVLQGELPRYSQEYPCHSPEQKRWFSMVVTPLGESSKGVVITHTDITLRKEAEDALFRQTTELRQRNAELERFNRVMVGRELDMIELKKQINALSVQLGQKPPFDLAFTDEPDAGEAPGGSPQ